MYSPVAGQPGGFSLESLDRKDDVKTIIFKGEKLQIDGLEVHLFISLAGFRLFAQEVYC